MKIILFFMTEPMNIISRKNDRIWPEIIQDDIHLWYYSSFKNIWHIKLIFFKYCCFLKFNVLFWEGECPKYKCYNPPDLLDPIIKFQRNFLGPITKFRNLLGLLLSSKLLGLLAILLSSEGLASGSHIQPDRALGLVFYNSLVFVKMRSEL